MTSTLDLNIERVKREMNPHKISFCRKWSFWCHSIDTGNDDNNNNKACRTRMSQHVCINLERAFIDTLLVFHLGLDSTSRFPFVVQNVACPCTRVRVHSRSALRKLHGSFDLISSIVHHHRTQTEVTKDTVRWWNVAWTACVAYPRIPFNVNSRTVSSRSNTDHIVTRILETSVRLNCIGIGAFLWKAATKLPAVVVFFYY